MKSLSVYANKRFKKLTEHLKSYQHIEDMQVLHEIRVEIKKVKALLNLTNYGLEKFKAHQHFKPFRAIFRQAGSIRQPDVFYKLLLRYQIGGVRDTALPNERKIDVLGAVFQRTIPHFITTIKVERKILSHYFIKVKKSDASTYLKNRIDDLRQLLFPRIKTIGLHKARKIVKEILYLNGVIRKGKPNCFYGASENIIGQWHDKQMLLPILRKVKKTDEVKKLQASCNEDIILLQKEVSKFYGNK